MATGSANHDFAPAWLKIPASSQQKSSSGEPRRDRSRSGFTHRQHSIDAEDLGTLSSSSSLQGGSHEQRLNSGQRQHSGSQPGRRPLSRQEFREGSCANFASSFSSGHKGHSFEGPSELHRSHRYQGRQRSFERGREGGSVGQLADVKPPSQPKEAISKKNDSVDKFDLEFPSLVGASNEDSLPSPVINGSVWDNGKSGKIHMSASVNKKLHLIQKPIGNDSKRSGSPAASIFGTSTLGSPKATSGALIVKQVVKNGSLNNSGSFYRAHLPAKGLVRMSSRDSSKLNGQLNKDSRNITSVVSEDSLNTQLVTHPKVLGNKKSDFLKEMREDGLVKFPLESGLAEPVVKNDRVRSCSEDSDVTVGFDKSELEAENGGKRYGCEDDKDSKDSLQARFSMVTTITNGVEQQGYGENMVPSNERNPENGIKIKALESSSDKLMLSSSLEAEQRLLREMGWKEEGSEDEGVYAPLTEDEKKEIERLSKVFQKRNGIQQRNLQVTWSPKRVFPIPKSLDLGNEEGSVSSSSDSDSD